MRELYDMELDHVAGADSTASCTTTSSGTVCSCPTGQVPVTNGSSNPSVVYCVSKPQRPAS